MSYLTTILMLLTNCNEWSIYNSSTHLLWETWGPGKAVTQLSAHDSFYRTRDLNMSLCYYKINFCEWYMLFIMYFVKFKNHILMQFLFCLKNWIVLYTTNVFLGIQLFVVLRVVQLLTYIYECFILSYLHLT